MRIFTASGSIYELNPTTKQARCISRLNRNASIRPTEDWRAYDDAHVQLGVPAVICWTSGTPLLEGSEGGVPSTVTSVVIKIEETV